MNAPVRKKMEERLRGKQMLAVSRYEPEYIAACKARMDAHLAAWRAMVAAVGAGPAVKAFEHECFNNMVLALDNCFLHRLRGAEGKDGNPLNEVRMMCGSLTHGGDRMTADRTIKYHPEKSVLGYRLGDTLALTADDFEKLAGAFLDQIALKYS